MTNQYIKVLECQGIDTPKEDLEEVLNRGESDRLDFKRQNTYKENKGELLRDIACLANSLAEEKYRFLIIGIGEEEEKGDKDKNTSQKKPNKLILPEDTGPTLNLVDDIMNKVKEYIYPVPVIKLGRGKVELDGKEGDIEIIEIKQDRLRLPYYFCNKCDENGLKIPKYAIFCRDGSSNTPKDAVARPEQIETMFGRKRGDDLDIKSRFLLYLDDPDSWELAELSAPQFGQEASPHQPDGPGNGRPDNFMFRFRHRFDYSFAFEVYTEGPYIQLSRARHGDQGAIANYRALLYHAPLSEEIWLQKRDVTKCLQQDGLLCYRIHAYHNQCKLQQQPFKIARVSLENITLKGKFYKRALFSIPRIQRYHASEFLKYQGLNDDDIFESIQSTAEYKLCALLDKKSDNTSLLDFPCTRQKIELQHQYRLRQDDFDQKDYIINTPFGIKSCLNYDYFRDPNYLWNLENKPELCPENRCSSKEVGNPKEEKPSQEA